MTRVVGLLLFGLVGGCGSKAVDESAAKSDGFARALEVAAGADPTQSASLLAQGAFESIAPSMKCFEGFGKAATARARMEALFDCGLACTPEVVQSLKGKEPRTWMAGLAADCKPGHFGLAAETAALLSPEWFLIHKVGELAAPHATGAGKAALDKAMAGFRLPLPLPAAATELYELATVPAEGSIPIASRTYVVMPESHGEPPGGMPQEGKPLRAGASPLATLSAGGAGIAPVAGQPGFPGKEVALQQLAAAAGGGAAARPAGRVVALKGAVDRSLRGDGAAGPPVPLLLADQFARPAEIIDVAAELGTVMLAVGSPEDPSARALPVRFSPLTGEELAAPPGTIRVTVGMLLAEVDVAPFDGGIEVPLDKVKELITAIERAASERPDGKLGEVIVDVQHGPWKEVAPVVALLAANGATGVILTTSDPQPDGPGPVHGRLPRVEVAAGATVSSDADAPRIDRVVRSWLILTSVIYRKELQANPGLSGQVQLEFTIQPDGAVADVRAGAQDDPTLARCATARVKRARFTPPKVGPVQVRYTLVFHPPKASSTGAAP